MSSRRHDLSTEHISERYMREVSTAVTEDQALAEFQTYNPDPRWYIETLRDGRVRIWRDKTKLTVRPTLREAVGIIRWYYVEHRGKVVPGNGAQV